MALLTRVRARLGIHAHRKVVGLLDGGYASVHTGRSMDFNDLREYVAGDEIKDIDWKASARSGQLLVKRYIAERKHTVWLVVATGRQLAAAATPTDSKADLAVLGAGMVGYLALRHADYVGLITGDAAGCHAERPSTRELNLERMLQLILDRSGTDAAETDLAGLLEHVIGTVRRRTIMLLVCDDIEVDEALADQLRRLRVQHELLVLTIGDLDVATPELAGRGIRKVADGAPVPRFVRSDARLSAELAELDAARAERRRVRLQQLGVASAHLRSADDALAAVRALLERHRNAR